MNYLTKSNACAKLLFSLAALTVAVSTPQSVRAQEWEDVGRLHADLNSFNQVPTALSEGSGRFEARINEDRTISYRLYYRNMSSSVTQAHIHFGASKTNGGIMVFLCGSPKPACPPYGEVTGTLTAADVSILPATNPNSVIPQGISPGDLAGVFSAILSGNSYVNVHTTKFPAGEIRGQVHIR